MQPARWPTGNEYTVPGFLAPGFCARNFFSSIFRAVGDVLKQALKNGILRSLITIIGCALPGVGQIGCAAISGLVTLASGGSIGESLKAFAFAWVSMGIFSAVGPTLNAIGGVGGALIKAGVHGIIGGALSVAQGGSFLQGFAGSAIGALGGALAGNSGLVGEYGDGNSANILGRALISGAAGCLGAVVTGGKCAQAALTAAFASMYNADGPGRAKAVATGIAIGTTVGVGLAIGCDAATVGVCALANPAIISGSAAIGGSLGYIYDSISGAFNSAANDNTKAHRNAAYSQDPNDLYNLINRDSGAIDKIGVSSKIPGGRYSEAYLAAQRVDYVTVWSFSSRYSAYLAENIALLAYKSAHGAYPRLNRVAR
jgi:hypothetical protein